MNLQFRLPGLGRTYLWVDGIQADPVAENTEKLTHFIWVDPEDLRLGKVKQGEQQETTYH